MRASLPIGQHSSVLVMVLIGMLTGDKVFVSLVPILYISYANNMEICIYSHLRCSAEVVLIFMLNCCAGFKLVW